MSALGAAPGYLYPRLDYGSAEFLSDQKAAFTNGAAGQITIATFTAANGFALLIQQVQTLYQCTGDVGTRNIFCAHTDSNGQFIDSYASPKAMVAADTSRHNWSTALSSAYVAVNNGYSPITAFIMPPGFSITVVVIGAFVNDIIGPTAIIGLRIPTTGTQAPQDELLATPRVT